MPSERVKKASKSFKAALRRERVEQYLLLRKQRSKKEVLMEKSFFIERMNNLLNHYAISITKERVDFYFEKLCHIDTKTFEQACGKWKYENNHFPTPSQLEKLANSLLSESIETRSIRFKQEEKAFAEDFFTKKKEKSDLGKFATSVVREVLDGKISGEEGMKKVEQFMEEHNIHPQKPPDPGDFPARVLKDLNITEEDVIQHLLSRSSRKNETPHHIRQKVHEFLDRVRNYAIFRYKNEKPGAVPYAPILDNEVRPILKDGRLTWHYLEGGRPKRKEMQGERHQAGNEVLKMKEEKAEELVSLEIAETEVDIPFDDSNVF